MIPLLVAAALTIPQAIDSAMDHYGPAACGRPTVVVEPAPNPAWAGWVSDLAAADCVIHLTPASADDPETSCAVIAHEYLHLQGHHHFDDHVHPDPAGPSGRVLEIPDWCIQLRTVFVSFKAWDVADYEGWEIRPDGWGG